MSYSRPHCFTVLDETFKDKNKKEEIHEKSIDILKNRPGSLSRIFDHFPCLLPKNATDKESKQNILQSLQNEFFVIIQNIEINSEDGISLFQKHDKEKIQTWTRKIIAFAILDLLNSDGYLKEEIISYLEWQQFSILFKKPESNISLLCSYVSMINQEIINNNQQDIQKNASKYYSFCDYLNKSLRESIESELENAGFKIKNSEKRSSQKNKTERSIIWPNENPKIGPIMVLAAITTATSIMFFKNNINTKKDISELKEYKF